MLNMLTILQSPWYQELVVAQVWHEHPGMPMPRLYLHFLERMEEVCRGYGVPTTLPEQDLSVRVTLLVGACPGRLSSPMVFGMWGASGTPGTPLLAGRHWEYERGSVGRLIGIEPSNTGHIFRVSFDGGRIMDTFRADELEVVDAGG